MELLSLVFLSFPENIDDFKHLEDGDLHSLIFIRRRKVFYAILQRFLTFSLLRIVNLESMDLIF